MPSAEGATCTSTIHSTQGDDTQVDTITDAGNDAFLVDTVRSQSDYVITWSCTPDGLLWLQTDGGMFSGVLQAQGLAQTWETASFDGVSLPKHIQPGDTWSSTQRLIATDSTGSRAYDISMNFEAIGIESVTVPAGSFDALRIDVVMTWTSQQIGEISYPISDWFAPGVGLVKSSAQGDFGSFDLALQSYTVP